MESSLSLPPTKQRWVVPLFVLPVEVYVVTAALGYLCYSRLQCLAHTSFHSEGLHHVSPRGIMPRAPTSMHRGCSFQPLFRTASADLLYFSCFRKCHFVMLSSHGEISSTQTTVLSLSDHIIPSGRQEVAAMWGGNGWFFDWPSRSMFRSNCNCQSSLASNRGTAPV